MAKPKPKKVMKGQLWLDENGRQASVELAIEGVGYRLMYVDPGPMHGFPLSITKASELVANPSWTFVGGPSDPDWDRES